MQAICLRRMKNDQVNGKPLVALPDKDIRVRHLDFNEEEAAIYKAYEEQGRKVIQKFLKRGTLLKNYAHVFALMMRLRQLCCHRELIKDVKWDQEDIDELVEAARRAAEEAAKEAERAAEASGVNEVRAHFSFFLA